MRADMTAGTASPYLTLPPSLVPLQRAHSSTKNPKSIKKDDFLLLHKAKGWICFSHRLVLISPYVHWNMLTLQILIPSSCITRCPKCCLLCRLRAHSRLQISTAVQQWIASRCSQCWLWGKSSQWKILFTILGVRHCSGQLLNLSKPGYFYVAVFSCSLFMGDCNWRSIRPFGTLIQVIITVKSFKIERQNSRCPNGHKTRFLE